MDVGDNVGGGAPGTSQVLLSECLRRGAANLLVVLHSPEGAARCAGESTGGRMATPWGWAAVRAVSDGRFSEPDARHGGWSEYDQGLTGVAETEQGTTLVFTSRRMAPFSLRQITSLGIKPEEKDILIVKGVIAPQAAYRPVCGAILLVDTPGPTAHDPRAFSYSHARRRLFPLDPGAVY
jgi:microcystin degradation protein MlrC